MQSLAATATKESPQLMRRAKIMVVDDDPALRQALYIRLRASQFEVVNACDGYSALALAQKERPDLILLDLGLPAGDGLTVLRHLRQFPALSTIPVIVLTAKDREPYEKRALDSGALAFIEKPVDNEELLWLIHLCLAAEEPRSSN